MQNKSNCHKVEAVHRMDRHRNIASFGKCYHFLLKMPIILSWFILAFLSILFIKDLLFTHLSAWKITEYGILLQNCRFHRDCYYSGYYYQWAMGVSEQLRYFPHLINHRWFVSSGLIGFPPNPELGCGLRDCIDKKGNSFKFTALIQNKRKQDAHKTRGII